MLIAALVLVAVGGLAYFALRPKEPAYQGKTAAEWFVEFQKAASTTSSYWRSDGNQLSGMVRTLDLEGLLRDPAAQGLKALGTNAALFLGNKFARRHSVLSHTYAQIYKRTPATLKRLLPMSQALDTLGDAQIFWALRGLREHALAAAPAIVAGLCNADNFTLNTAISTLRELHFPPVSLDELVKNLSVQGRHEHALRIISQLQIRSPVAANCLSRGLASAKPAERHRYLYELEQFGADAVIALPAITAALKDPDADVRYAAARAIGAIGIQAASTAASLSQATNDESIMVQHAAARALRQVRAE